MGNSKGVIDKWMGFKEFRWSIGNGKSTLFWLDIWCGNKLFKEEFPRLYRLAILKNRKVADYLMDSGFTNGKWDEFFIRPLLDRVLKAWNNLLNIVKSVELYEEREDIIIWIHDNKGVFTVKKLTTLLCLDEGEVSKFAFDKI